MPAAPDHATPALALGQRRSAAWSRTPQGQQQAAPGRLGLTVAAAIGLAAALSWSLALWVAWQAAPLAEKRGDAAVEIAYDAQSSTGLRRTREHRPIAAPTFAASTPKDPLGTPVPDP